MYYEINVSRKVGPFQSHFFATAPRSLTTMKEVKEAAAIFFTKFPASEGYQINISRHEESGRDVTAAFIEPPVEQVSAGVAQGRRHANL